MEIGAGKGKLNCIAKPSSGSKRNSLSAIRQSDSARMQQLDEDGQALTSVCDGQRKKRWRRGPSRAQERKKKRRGEAEMEEGE